jgi:hypothetical protein
MKFHIPLSGAQFDLARLQSVITAVDPAAVIDRDPLVSQLRISAGLSVGELQVLARDAGLELTEAQIQRQPSECCGGCGG